MGNIKKKTQDNFTGEILQFGQKIVDIRGNYMGYMDFNGVRYFDVRELEHYFFPVLLTFPLTPIDGQIRRIRN